MRNKKTFDERVDDFRNIITFLTIINIKKHFKTLDNYLKSSQNKKAYHLHIDDKKVVRRLSHTKSESLLKRILEVTKNDFTYHRHCHRTYRGGKFKLNSWFEIPEDRLRELFADSSNFNTRTCGFLTSFQHKWIDEHVFYSRKRDDSMTKAQEDEIREKEARGELCTTADYVIRQEKRKERAEERRKISIAKKAVKSTISEYAKIVAENECLKREIEVLKGEVNRLKAICDADSDIPEEAPVHKLSYEEFAERYPEGVDPETFDFSVLSDECKAKCQAMYDQQMKASMDLIPHDKLESIRKQLALLGEDDIPDDEELNAELDEAIMSERTQPTHVFEAPPELAEKKVVETPADDIPASTEEELSKLERQINRLQGFVNKLYISVNEARAIAEFFGRGLMLKAARSGFSAQDAQTHKKERGGIFTYFKNELEAKQLVTTQASTFFRNNLLAAGVRNEPVIDIDDI